MRPIYIINVIENAWDMKMYFINIITKIIIMDVFQYEVIKWKHFPIYWPIVRGIHRSPVDSLTKARDVGLGWFLWSAPEFVREIHRSAVNSPLKGQWRGALMFSLICARINGWVNNGEAGDLRRHRVHYDVIVMAISRCEEAVKCRLYLNCQNGLIMWFLLMRTEDRSFKMKYFLTEIAPEWFRRQ